ncbi:DUF4376 domain-containing protein [Escherichia coli]|uniref:DUF4376 domain-containing protein n=1 Tax=Escherichia coli TaxID=562 RepID=UPI001859FF8E|nr:DUF4376 domain-containing protein [Escherichia coli]EKI3096518.1 DUF4376 domain-containing protein [Escherichia coli]MBB9841287.1 DUF4376 domain-containing protein [Escherichia coli]MBS9328545.1 DUF4376 domain-containing protein [Escherichia coli]
MTFEFSDEPQIIQVYNYHPNSNEYTGECDCYIAPNTGLPDFCTLEKPPEVEPGKTLVWVEGKWAALEDHRGAVVYSKDTGQRFPIDAFGPLPESVTVIKPNSEFDRWNGETWIPDPNDVKSAKVNAIKQLRDKVTADYIVIDGNHFHSDTSSRIQQMSLTKMGQAKQIPAGLMWQTKNNGLIPLTNEIAAQFEMVTMDHDMRLFANSQYHITAIEALTDVQEIQDYDYSTGWQP